MKARFVYEAIGDILRPKIVTDDDYVKFFKIILASNKCVNFCEINDLSITFGIPKLKIRQILRKMGILKFKTKNMIGRIITPKVANRSYIDKDEDVKTAGFHDLFMITGFISSDYYKACYREKYALKDLKTNKSISMHFWPSQKSEYYFRLPTEEEIEKYNL